MGGNVTKEKKVKFWIFGRKDRRVFFHVGVRQGDKKRDDRAVEATKIWEILGQERTISYNIAVARKVKKGNLEFRKEGEVTFLVRRKAARTWAMLGRKWW